MKKILFLLVLTVVSTSLIAQAMGTVNDTRVRLRSEPNLQSETKDFLNTGDEVYILSKTDYSQTIDTMDAPWYEVLSKEHGIGWMYGFFLDTDYENSETAKFYQGLIRLDGVKDTILRNFFAYGMAAEVDFISAKPLFSVAHDYVLDTSVVKSITVPTIYYGSKTYYKYSFEDGRLVYDRVRNYLGSKEYIYDITGLLVRKTTFGDADNDYSFYTYNLDVNGTTLNIVEEYNGEKNSYVLSITDKGYTLDGSSYEHRSGVLTEIKDIYSGRTDLYEYSSEGILKSITTVPKNSNKALWRYTMHYTNALLTKLTIEDVDDGEIRTYLFSEHDTYGNWTKQEKFDSDGELESETLRTIEYW